MKKVNQILTGFQEGEPPFEGVMKLAYECNASGIPHQLFVRNVKDLFYSSMLPLERLEADDATVSVFHLWGSDLLDLELIKSIQGKKILVRYFTADPSTFVTYSEQHVTGISQSRATLAAGSHLFNQVFADSLAASQELVSFGFSNVTPLTGLNLPRDFSKLAVKDFGKDFFSESSVVFLASDPLIPNQRIEEVIRLFAWYRRVIDADAQLVILGRPLLREYVLFLRDLIHSLSIQTHVLFLEDASRAEIKACYESADLMISMGHEDISRREWIEANQFGIPVVIPPHSGAKEIWGDQGVYVHGSDIPMLGEWIDMLVHDKSMREKILRIQKLGCQDYLGHHQKHQFLI